MSNTNAETNTNKAPKKLGPIRVGVLIPTIIIIALTIAYFMLFFDSNLKAGLEYAGTQVHGAEVNIARVRTSFTKPSVTVSGIQITDKNKPHRNLFQIERIHFQFLWDALLRAKAVVDDAAIDNIQALVPRKRPGFVVPETKPDGKPTAMKKIEDGVVNQAKQQFNENVLGDVANVVGGADPSKQLKDLQTQLKADVRIKELEKELAVKQKAWEERIKNLPQAKEFDALAKRAKKLKFDSKNPLEVAKSIAEADKILREADKKVKALKKASKSLESDVGGFNSEIKGLDKLAQQDLKDLQKRLKIPNLNVADFSMGLFGRMFQTKVANVRKYMEVGRKYMPPKKTKEQKQPELIPAKRGDGKNFHYPVAKGYPKVWIKRAYISSKPSDSEYSGNLSGEILDVTSDPVYLGRPTTMQVKGDFPKQQIFGLDANIVVDHTTAEPYEKGSLTISSYPVTDVTLSNSKDVKLIMQQASAQVQAEITLKNQQMWVTYLNNFKDLKYDIDASSNSVKEILTNIVNDIPIVTVNSKATGSWEKINWSLRSNLGDELSKGFKKQLEAKLREAKAKLKAHIDAQINAEKQKLLAQFNKAKSKVTGELNKKKAEVETARKQAEQKIKAEQKQGTAKAKQKNKKKAKKALKDLKKSLGL